MNKPFLTVLPLTYADSVSFENSGSIFSIKIFNREHKLVILLKNILLFNFSKDSLKSEKDDYVDIIEITHEYRKLTQDDLKKYSFYPENIDELPLLHTVTLYGNTIIEVICEEVEVQSHSPMREKESELTVNY
ncbi:hypothetical protein [Phormidium nigroviride]